LFFSADGSRCTLGSRAGIAAGQFIVDSVNKYHYAPTSAEAQGQDMLQWFFSKRVAIIPDFGPWNIPLLRPVKDINWTVIPEFGKPVPIEVDGLAISQTSKNAQAAATFVKFMTQSATVQTILGAGPAASGVPVIKGAVSSFLHQMPSKNLRSFVAAMMDTTIAPAPRANSNQAELLLSKEINDMTPLGTGHQSPAAAFPVIARDVTRVINGSGT
jgi:multiple sugar transport system substrate-binding protein